MQIAGGIRQARVESRHHIGVAFEDIERLTLTPSMNTKQPLTLLIDRIPDVARLRIDLRRVDELRRDRFAQGFELRRINAVLLDPLWLL